MHVPRDVTTLYFNRGQCSSSRAAVSTLRDAWIVVIRDKRGPSEYAVRIIRWRVMNCHDRVTLAADWHRPGQSLTRSSQLAALFSSSPRQCQQPPNLHVCIHSCLKILPLLQSMPQTVISRYTTHHIQRSEGPPAGPQRSPQKP